MNGPTGTPLSLLTFAPMVDSECSRLLLAHYRVDYVERDHLLESSAMLTLFHGGYGRVPLLYGSGVSLTSPRRIAEHFEPLQPPARRLIPEEGPLRDDMEAAWRRYNDDMGADTAAFAYHYLLPRRALMEPIFTAPLPGGGKKLPPWRYPMMKGMLQMLLRLGPERAQKAHDRIRTIFDETGKRIADGRPYVCGDRLTLADAGLASAAAPLLLPRGYGARMPALDEVPEPLRSAMAALRAHPVAGFVQRLYDTAFGRTREAAPS
ncbi:MAG: hypothetical protein JOZ90_10660 [Alphaproteobacteria bacterium]|nr:hypothetical protein [Alphaproteobacteria bacterium]MBV9371081.1 hypothetical protein [Alphaproteobacteria bacterium]MBV9901545.1 hypothetical protein [Alphaproteobacteria bacterium]